MPRDIDIEFERDDCAPAKRLTIVAELLALGVLRSRTRFCISPPREHASSSVVDLEASAPHGLDGGLVNAPQNGEP